MSSMNAFYHDFCRQLPGSNARVYGNVSVGKRCRIAPTAVLIGPLAIGDDVEIGEYCVIGSPAEHRDSKEADDQQLIYIGNRTVIREHVVVQRGTRDGRGTAIGHDCYIMHGCHIAHDCQLSDGVTLSPKVVLGGHTSVQYGANMGIGSSTHQRVTIGAAAMVGMGAVCVRDVGVLEKVAGVPARWIGTNKPKFPFTTEQEVLADQEFRRVATRPAK